MPIVLAIVAIVALVVLANFLAARKNETFNRLFGWLLFSFNLPLALVGTAFVLISPDLLARLQWGRALPSANLRQIGIVLLGMAIWGAVASLPSMRRALARLLPLNAASPVHTLALVLSGYLAGNTLLTLAQGGLEEFAQTAVSPTLFDFVAQQLIFAAVAIVGAGLFIRRGFDGARKRLGLEQLTWRQLLVGIRWIIILVLLQWAIGALWFVLDPAQSELLDNVNEVLLGNYDTAWEWIILAVTAGIGEELLFRGALQPVLGLRFTAVLFALAHVQYGFTPATLAIFVIGIVLGTIRRNHNTTLTIFIHAGYDLVLGLLTLLVADLA